MSFSLGNAPTYRASGPYTFFVPHDRELAALSVGDSVKLIFEYDTPGEKWSAERMWVQIDTIDGERLTGRLDNNPDEGFLKLGETIVFERSNVIAIDWVNPNRAPKVKSARAFWDFCLVDDCVLDGSEPVEYLYREEPETSGEDSHEDSGWRLRGREGNATDEQMANRDVSFVALGAVLNRDDSWISLLDSPVGSAFMRDFESNKYVPVSHS